MIGLVFCGDLKYCPYLSRYTERLELHDVPYVVLFWNRGGYKLQLKDNYIGYNSESPLESNKIRKALDFVSFRSWVIKQLKKLNVDQVIALSTLSGVILGRHLYGKRKGKYVFDVRDYSYEHIKPVFEIEKKLVENSAFTAISSGGFRAFLPEHDYVIAHNFNRKDIQSTPSFKKREEGPIRVVWNGLVRYFEFQKQYIDALANDDRFLMIYHGDGPELSLYKQFCEEKNVRNITFTGAYNNADKAKLLEGADILNNCYGYTVNAGNKLKYAVSNRFYDGLIFHRPQLVEPEGYKSDWAEKACVGTAMEPFDDFADRLYEYYHGLDESFFDKACERTLREVISDDDRYIDAIDRFINSQ